MERKVLSAIVPVFAVLILITGVILIAKDPSLTGLPFTEHLQKLDCIEVSDKKQVGIDGIEQCCTKIRQASCVRLDITVDLPYKTLEGNDKYTANYICHTKTNRIYTGDSTMLYCQSKYGLDID